MKQLVMDISAGVEELDEYLLERQISSIFVVAGQSLYQQKIYAYLEALKQQGSEVVIFHDFEPNPRCQSVRKGIALYQKNPCQVILAVGGGSAMDVAKCIKLYARADVTGDFLSGEKGGQDIPLLAMPTTAGTGSEATHFAVIYVDGEKQSVADRSLIPEVVLWDTSVLDGLPDYHKKASFLDALCHGIESFWSVHATPESQEYSSAAIRGLLDYYQEYFKGPKNPEWNYQMLKAAYQAGKAINLTQTTAGHAMSYKLTSLYGLAHGHSAALCVLPLWRDMIDHCELCADPRGTEYIQAVFTRLAILFGGTNPSDGVERFEAILKELKLTSAIEVREGDLDILVQTVNPQRLKNNPVMLSEETIKALYLEVLNAN